MEGVGTRITKSPASGARILAFLFKISRRSGPSEALGFKIPPPKGETIFMKSFDDTLARAFAGLRKSEPGNWNCPTLISIPVNRCGKAIIGWPTRHMQSCSTLTSRTRCCPPNRCAQISSRFFAILHALPILRHTRS